MKIFKLLKNQLKGKYLDKFKNGKINKWVAILLILQ
jgi:hypothetical protein